MRAMRFPWFPNATQAHLSLWRDHAERRVSVLDPYRDRPEAQTRTRLTETSLCSASGDSLFGSTLQKPPRRSSHRTRFRRPSSLKQTLRLTQSSDDQTEASAETPCRTAQSAYSQILLPRPSPVRLPSVACSRQSSCRERRAGTQRSSRPQSKGSGQLPIKVPPRLINCHSFLQSSILRTQFSRNSLPRITSASSLMGS